MARWSVARASDLAAWRGALAVIVAAQWPVPFSWWIVGTICRNIWSGSAGADRLKLRWLTLLWCSLGGINSPVDFSSLSLPAGGH